MRMIRGLAPVLEAHHKVPVLYEALEAAALRSATLVEAWPERAPDELRPAP